MSQFSTPSSESTLREKFNHFRGQSFTPNLSLEAGEGTILNFEKIKTLLEGRGFEVVKTFDVAGQTEEQAKDNLIQYGPSLLHIFARPDGILLHVEEALREEDMDGEKNVMGLEIYAQLKLSPEQAQKHLMETPFSNTFVKLNFRVEPIFTAMAILTENSGSDFIAKTMNAFEAREGRSLTSPFTVSQYEEHMLTRSSETFEMDHKEKFELYYKRLVQLPKWVQQMIDPGRYMIDAPEVDQKDLSEFMGLSPIAIQ